MKHILYVLVGLTLFALVGGVVALAVWLGPAFLLIFPGALLLIAAYHIGRDMIGG